ncbi:MAG: AMP-binding protein, partial [Waddliaceae bacterium]
MMFEFDHALDRVGLVDGKTQQQLTYEQINNLAAPLQSSLPSQKILVFFFIHRDLPSILTYIGLMRLNHAVALFDPNLQMDLKQRLVDTYRPGLIIDSLSSAPWEDYEPHLLPTGSISHRVKHRDESSKLHPELKLLLSTSGTTGSPKLVRLSERNLVSNGKSIIESLAISPEDCAITSLPIHYSYGLSVLHSHLLAGARVVITDESVVQRPFWDIFHQCRCTSFAGVPYTYELLDRMHFETFPVPTLQTMTQAGGRLRQSLVLKFHKYMTEKGGRFFVMYGQTEATARIAYLPPSALPEKACAIGVAIPKGSLTASPEGELIYSGQNVMLGYATAAEDLAKGDALKGILH